MSYLNKPKFNMLMFCPFEAVEGFPSRRGALTAAKRSTTREQQEPRLSSMTLLASGYAIPPELTAERGPTIGGKISEKP